MDLIDKRNEKERLKRSIVKYWNVAYTADKKAITSAGYGNPAADGQEERDFSYNKTTGSRSGEYGKQPVAEEHADKIDGILEENKFDLEKILKDTENTETTQSEEAGEAVQPEEAEEAVQPEEAEETAQTAETEETGESQ